MRTVTINWATTTELSPGNFVPAGYRVTIGGFSVNVAQSPAVFTEFGDAAPGPVNAVVSVVDTDGNMRGTPLYVPFDLPQDMVAINAPVNGNAVVVVS